MLCRMQVRMVGPHTAICKCAKVPEAMRPLTGQWLGVQVPREWNQDGDRLSHPARLSAVRADAEARGVSTSVASIPDWVWDELRQAMAEPGGDAVFGGGGHGVVDAGSSSG